MGKEGHEVVEEGVAMEKGPAARPHPFGGDASMPFWGTRFEPSEAGQFRDSGSSQPPTEAKIRGMPKPSARLSPE